MTLYTHIVYSHFLLVGSIGTTIGSHFAEQFTRLNLLEPIALVWMIPNVIADGLITVSLAWYLVIS